MKSYNTFEEAINKLDDNIFLFKQYKLKKNLV